MKDSESIENLKLYYQSLYAQHGSAPESLGWTKGKQRLRYAQLVGNVELQGKRILDVGCGFGDLFAFVAQHTNGNFSYTGIDAVAQFIDEASQKYSDPRASFLEGDFATYDFGDEFDIVVASGTFNLSGGLTYKDSLESVGGLLEKMWRLSGDFAAADFLTDQVDYTEPHLVYFAPADILNRIAKFTRRFELHKEMLPFEYAVRVYQDDTFRRDSTVFLASQGVKAYWDSGPQ